MARLRNPKSLNTTDEAEIVEFLHLYQVVFV
jgi:hypothetical protein